MNPGELLTLNSQTAFLHEKPTWWDIPGTEMVKGETCLVLEVGDYDGPQLGFELRVLNPRGSTGWINSSSLSRVG